MLFKNSHIIKGGDKFLSITPDSDIVLKFTVQGTCFPAKITQGNNNTSSVSFRSLPNISNKIYINYNDGTGEHEYDFKSSGSDRWISFRNLATSTTPEQAQGDAWYDATIHFYQDLPEGVKNTVQDEYPQQREITIRFEKPQNIFYFQWYFVRVFGVFPSGISKFRNLETLNVTQALYVTAFAQDFYNSQILNLTLSNFGDVMSQGFPLWVLNSNNLEMINLNGSIDLSGDPVAKKFNLINRLKDTLKNLNIGRSGINYKIPEEFSELYKLEQLSLINNTSSLLRFPDDISGLVSLNTLALHSTRMPFEEIERIIQSIPSLKSVNINSCAYNNNYDFDEENYSLQEINIGAQTWGLNGSAPDFISKLKALKTIIYTDVFNSPPSNVMKSYGDLSANTELETINISRLTDFTTLIPAWFNVLTKLKNISIYASFQNSGGIDSYVNNFYDFIVANASMSVGSTPFRNMTIDAYGTNISDQNNSTRPSGTYQQPSGYIQGSSNGTPASPMEKIWVLTNQYGHTWIVKPS